MNEFEKACEEVEKRSYESDCENAIEWIRDSDIATVTFSQGRFITKIRKLAEKYPDEVQIVAENKKRDGNVSSIVAHIPTRYIQISNRKRDLSEEDRKVLSERAKNIFHAALDTDETP